MDVASVKVSPDETKSNRSRLVAQNNRDQGALSTRIRSTTVSRFGERIAIAIAAIFRHHSSYIRDVPQSYVQSESVLDRKVYANPPTEMNLPETKTLLIKASIWNSGKWSPLVHYISNAS